MKNQALIALVGTALIGAVNPAFAERDDPYEFEPELRHVASDTSRIALELGLSGDVLTYATDTELAQRSKLRKDGGAAEEPVPASPDALDSDELAPATVQEQVEEQIQQQQEQVEQEIEQVQEEVEQQQEPAQTQVRQQRTAPASGRQKLRVDAPRDAEPEDTGRRDLRRSRSEERDVAAPSRSRLRRDAPEKEAAPPPLPIEIDPTAVEPPDKDLPDEMVVVENRWEHVEAIGVEDRWWDPYNQNTLKGDRPIFEDYFINLLLISDTIVEPRSFPTPVPANSSEDAGELDVFGGNDQLLLNQTFTTSVSLIKGDTAYKPPDLELRITPVFNFNRVYSDEPRFLEIDPGNGSNRTDHHFGLQEFFLDYHLRNVSARYDFDSIRVGIQPFQFDFRGFLFQDQQLGIRLFGTRDNNIFQYSLGYIRRLEKDTNSGLNSITDEVRDDEIFFANLFWQDFPVLGYISQWVVAHNRNREGNDELFFDDNGFISRPASLGDERRRDYDVTYIGFNGDGHFGRFNLTHSFYFAFGEDSPNQFNGFGEDAKVRAYFIALEPSIDFSWIRIRGSFLHASGDNDPFDDKETGFDAIFENPQFAGFDTSYWIRQAIPLIGGGGVVVTGRNGVLPSLRSSKEQGQSNFNNPGLTLIGLGTDFDVSNELRISTNFNYLRFDNTSSLEFARNQGDIDKEIGWDLSLALIWRPFFTQNVVFRASGAVLIAGDGFKDLYETESDDDIFYSGLFNLTLTF